MIGQSVQTRGPGAATRWVGVGIAAGILAGIPFIVFEMVMSWALGKPPLMPLGAIGGILLGKSALANPTPELLLTGFLLHEGLASVFGLTFGIIAAIVAAGRRYVDVPGPSWRSSAAARCSASCCGW